MPGQFISLALSALLSLAAPTSQTEAPLVVSAAISLTDVLEEIERAYTAAGGGPVRFNLAASNVLARQIANGAPVDVFISADLAQMQYAERAGAILPGSSRYLLSNRLAVVTPPGRRLAGPDVRALADASIARIAIGDPAAVPAGFYARQYLERAGLWQSLQPKLLSLPNVRAALAAVESGGADAAIVYESDAAASKKVSLAFVVPATEAPPIVYPAAIVTRSKNRAAAEKFLAFLQGPQAGALFERYKFRPDPGPRAPRPAPRTPRPAPRP